MITLWTIHALNGFNECYSREVGDFLEVKCLGKREIEPTLQDMVPKGYVVNTKRMPKPKDIERRNLNSSYVSGDGYRWSAMFPFQRTKK